VYGEGLPDDQTLNLRTRVFKHFDTAGVATREAYDFKGNLPRGSREVAPEYKGLIDWNTAQPPGEVFSTSTTYDALNRPTSVITPDGSVYSPTYNEANLLEKVDLNLRGGAGETPFVTNIDYNAKGQRIRVDYGNGASTDYEYDQDTFRLSHLITRGAGTALQDLRYTYDPAGNITHIQDAAQQTVYFNNQVVTPDTDYTYDATYRLIEAQGREHIGQLARPETTWGDEFRVNLPHPQDGQAMRNYTEQYEYDAVGNFEQLIHQAANGNWTRRYTYIEASLLEPEKTNNRLSGTMIGRSAGKPPSPETYSYDAHGNMTRMPHLTVMDWDFKDRLCTTSRQVNNIGTPETTFYVYDASGQRVRKVTERQNGTRKEERIYLGGFELYREYDGTGNTVTLERETLHVIDDKQRIALVESRMQGDDGSPMQLIRYQFSNHLGSAILELNNQAQVISYEEYYPYGSTSYQAVDKSINSAAKRYRYTGKERDEETGFYYHGARYYAPWVGRWLSPDPLGLTNSINIFTAMQDNPLKYSDPTGMADELPEYDPSMGPILQVGPSSPSSPKPFVVAFGRADSGYMRTAERNTGLRAINIQDSINIRRGLGIHFPSSGPMEQRFLAPVRGSDGLYPMFSGVMTQEALEGKAADTVHFDARGVDPTPPLPEKSQPGFANEDFHSSSELRQGIAHLASTGPGERKVNIVIQHEGGVTTIPRDSNTAVGAPLPSRLADRMPNIANPAAPEPAAQSPAPKPVEPATAKPVIEPTTPKPAVEAAAPQGNSTAVPKASVANIAGTALTAFGLATSVSNEQDLGKFAALAIAGLIVGPGPVTFLTVFLHTDDHLYSEEGGRLRQIK
jgi:RHS repeat-associated protein